LRRTFGDAFDFVIVREIARGGMGTVYEALQCGVRGFSKRVALKVLLPEISRSDDLRELFVGEAHLVADLVHENIVQIYHLGEIPADPDDPPAERHPRLFFSMELIEGVPLDAVSDKLRAGGERLDADLAAFVASRVARALEYAHARSDGWGRPLGIVHRDVCPSNILLARGGVVKLSDFGVAKARYRSGRLGMPEDESKVIVGRARYMSPEAARFENTDLRSDVYSLGVVLHELLAGADAFRSAEGRVRSLLPLRMLRPDVPERLEKIVARALERDPARRYATAGGMGLDLEKFMYDKGYGPTNLTLAARLRELFPDPSEGREVSSSSSTAGVVA
jgi:serine/threonine protein kinase